MNQLFTANCIRQDVHAAATSSRRRSGRRGSLSRERWSDVCYAASCDPRCGKCRPKRIVETKCPVCGHLCSITREEYLLLFDLPHKRNVMEEKILEHGGVERPVCSMCGSDMKEAFRVSVSPKPCRANRVVCGFPCGRSDDPYKEGRLPCTTMVPVGKLSTSPYE